MSPHIFVRRHEGEFDGGCGKGRSWEKMMMPTIDSFLVTWPPRVLSILRIIVGTRVSPRVERRKELVTTERYWMNSPLPEVLGREMEPFQEQFVVVLDPGVANGGAFQQVPAGKRAVIEHASVHADPADAAVKANYFITSTIGGTSNFRDVPILVVRWGIAVVGSHPVRAYADPGSEYGGTIRRLETTQRLAATFVFAGYYVPS